MLEFNRSNSQVQVQVRDCPRTGRTYISKLSLFLERKFLYYGGEKPFFEPVGGAKVNLKVYNFDRDITTNSH